MNRDRKECGKTEIAGIAGGHDSDRSLKIISIMVGKLFVLKKKVTSIGQ